MGAHLTSPVDMLQLVLGGSRIQFASGLPSSVKSSNYIGLLPTQIKLIYQR